MRELVLFCLAVFALLTTIISVISGNWCVSSLAWNGVAAVLFGIRYKESIQKKKALEKKPQSPAEYFMEDIYQKVKKQKKGGGA